MSAFVEEKKVQMRSERNRLLNDVDVKYCNAEQWELMTEEQKQAWRDYKQQLRDVPEQEGFPLNITWPDIPI